jgi:hypothetical protein
MDVQLVPRAALHALIASESLCRLPQPTCRSCEAHTMSLKATSQAEIVRDRGFRM